MLHHLLVLYRYISKGENEEGTKKKILGKRGRVRIKKKSKEMS